MDVAMRLYDLNKAFIKKNMQPMDVITLNMQAEKINKWNKDYKYVLLYCKETGYFTFFVKKEEEEAEMPFLGTAVLEILHEYDVYCIDEDEEGETLDIWFKNKTEDDDPKLMKLMPWEEGVITYAR